MPRKLCLNSRPITSLTRQSIKQFVDAALKPNGFTAADLDDVVADNLRYAGVSQLVKGSSPLPEAMFKQQYEQLNQKMSGRYPVYPDPCHRCSRCRFPANIPPKASASRETMRSS